MHPEAILKFSLKRGFGQLLWLLCPVCHNLMRHTRWEDGTTEEHCPACSRRLRCP
jgi:rubrerythrin